MGEFRNRPVNSNVIKNILTLNYNPSGKTLLPRLTWRDFVEKNVEKPIEMMEETISKSIESKIGFARKRVAVTLSGGVDSTLILAVLRKTLPEIRVDAMSFRFPNSIDETPQAVKIAEKLDANHHVVNIENLLQDLPRWISIIKLPIWDLHWYYVAKKAKELSNIYLSGDGGDELFGGYTFRYRKFLSLTNPKSSPIDKIKAYLHCHERDWVSEQDKIFSKKMSYSWDKIYALLQPYFNNPLPSLAQVFLADFNGKLLYNWLPTYARVNRHFGLKLVTPLLSDELISYATHIPYSLKYDIKLDIGKVLLRKLLEKYKVNQLVSETKQGFAVNTLNLWKESGHDLCSYYLSDSRIVKHGLVNSDWIKSHMNNINGKKDVRLANKFLGLLAFEIWFRMFITKEISPNLTLK